MAQNLPRGTPARLLVILTLLVGLVMVSAWRDALQRDRAVWVTYPTALGAVDNVRPDQLPCRLEHSHPPAVISRMGQGEREFRDDTMFRVLSGRVEIPFGIFRSGETGPQEEYFARLRPGKYLPVTLTEFIPAQLPPAAGTALRELSPGAPAESPAATPGKPDQGDSPVKPPANKSL